ncbi:acyl-CoA thioesterase [Clostridium massiliamazoniense]|uniref:acyl-CoA thioesterase n=1 Tax=Clostridium massiliamazoniense TaxID=1347366 RepID=UPI000AEDB17A|nr:thioesterase family protein [Clostridium massiliamazoniense]
MSMTNIRVRYAETDAMRIVHHANYYLYFEVAREDLIKELGVSYREIEEMGIMMPLVETECKYIEAAKYDDDLIIEAKIIELTAVKVRIEYNVIKKENNKIIAKGSTLQTFIDRNNFKIINLKRVNSDLWQKLSESIL